MSKEYKNVSDKERRKKNSPGLPWLWLITGLLTGALITFLIMLSLQDKQKTSPQSTLKKTIDNTLKKIAEQPKKIKEYTSKFDFYKILPEFEDIIPDFMERPATATIKKKIIPGTYVLQVGSFRKTSEADTLRAQLALTGIETSIEHVVIKNEDWYRVRLGPFSNPDILEKQRDLLQKNGIDAILLSIRKKL